VLNYLTAQLGASEEVKQRWYHHWVDLGLSALEVQVARSPHTGAFCCGDTPSIADCCLVPQLFNARRFDCDLSRYPTLLGVEHNCNQLAAFQRAAPELQPDANA
jgi:maleylacetoacetate isomerase